MRFRPKEPEFSSSCRLLICSVHPRTENYLPCLYRANETGSFNNIPKGLEDFPRRNPFFGIVGNAKRFRRREVVRVSTTHR